jgi:murein DD-endopeptidase MepM/ murein hydrolase activator NlpD
MPARRLALPRAAAPPLALAAVAGLLTAVIATGHPAVAGVRAATQTFRPAAAASSVVDGPGVVAGAAFGTVSTTPDGNDVARALGALASTDDATAHRASRASERSPLHRWVRPNGGPLTSPFGYRWGRLHAGIDLAGPYGSPILAATDGCISYAGPMSGYGEVVQITDWDGTETVYGHMSAFVRRSGCVKAGQEIALVGSAGDATGPHLHFEVRVNGVPIDPIPFLATRGLYI